MNICIDGEIEMSDTADIRIVPGALNFSIPRGSRLIAEAQAEEEMAAL